MGVRAMNGVFNGCTLEIEQFYKLFIKCNADNQCRLRCIFLNCYLYKIFKIIGYPFYESTAITEITGKDLTIMEMILETTDLCKSFKGQRAVERVSLHVRKNSVYGLVGPNGAGKSTTLKMITGILKPTSGTIMFDGQSWRREALNQMGALIEMPPLYENLTAYENLKVRAMLLGLEDARIKEVLQIVRLTDTGKKRAGQFSLGMKQRLGIAIALLNHPNCSFCMNRRMVLIPLASKNSEN